MAISMQPINDNGSTTNSPEGGASPQTITPQPQPQVMHQAPQPMVMGSVNQQVSHQGGSPLNIPVQYQVQYKKLYANDWYIMGIVSCVFGLMGPSLCWLISLVGAILMASKLNIVDSIPGHPEAEKVKSALIVNIIALVLPIVAMVVLFSIGFY
ncbi:MAG: hypothetical protein HOE92_06600 [Euryarchaeota archaeon]|jgi:hypothetical protein|nr:hypothetical protein [Euryarchaeota archaeon]